MASVTLVGSRLQVPHPALIPATQALRQPSGLATPQLPLLNLQSVQYTLPPLQLTLEFLAWPASSFGVS